MDDVLAMRSEYRLQQWSEMARACRESGLSNKEFCRQNGISEKTYYYWLRRLRQVACENTQPKLVRLDAAKDQEPDHCAILLRYKDAELEIRAGTDCDTIATVLQALKSI